MDRNQIKTAYNLLLQEDPYSLLRTVVLSTELFRAEILYRRIKLRLLYGAAAPSPYTILDVDPDRIRYWAPNHNRYDFPERGFQFSKHPSFDVRTWNSVGETIDGDWDRRENLYLLTETPKYQSVESHFADGTPWEETAVFDIFPELIEEYGKQDGCENKRELKRRYEEFEAVYESLKENGYKSQRELRAGEGISKHTFDEIGIGIGRDGKILFIGCGWHRLCLSKILGLDSVKVRVICRHSGWQDRRREIVEADAFDQLQRSTKAKITHPDLADIVPTDWKTKSAIVDQH